MVKPSRIRALRKVAISLLAIAAAAPAAVARPGGWGGPAWRGGGWDRMDETASSPQGASRDRSREGRIQVSRFLADGIASEQLGHGQIEVTSRSGSGDFIGGSERAVFEAAVVECLVRLGYDTAAPTPQGGQSAELHVSESVVESGKPRHGPVTGEAAMQVGNRGTAYGLAVAVDLTKPLKPLLSTQLEARIVDRPTGKVLWEGRADIATREGDAKWTRQEIAAKLAEALFEGFPKAT